MKSFFTSTVIAALLVSAPAMGQGARTLNGLQYEKAERGTTVTKGIYVRLVPDAGFSAFGEQLVAENTPVYESGYVYQTVSQLHRTNNQAGGTLVVQNGFAEASSGASANGLGNLQSARFIKYRPGQGVMARFTTLFDTPTSLSVQLHGVSNAENGFFVGYRLGTEFSFVHQRDGALEIQKLTIATASSTTENITITLNGTAVTDVGVTNSASTTATAWEIGQHDFSAIEDIGYEVFAEGSDVFFVRLRSAAVAGAFTLSGATTAAGSFSQVRAGADATFNVFLKSEWNRDRMDGSNDEFNPSGVDLDPTKLNIFQIQYQYLGGGGIELFIEDPNTSRLSLVHVIEYANNNTTPSLSIPSMAMSLSAFAASAGNDVTIKTSSQGGFTQGPRNQIGPKYAALNTVTSVTTTLTPIISIKGRGVYSGKSNFTEALLRDITFAADGAKPVELFLVLDATLNNTANFQAVNSDSAYLIDTSATTITGGTNIIPLVAARLGADIKDMKGEDVFINRYRTLTLAARATSTTSDVTGGLAWVEDL